MSTATDPIPRSAKSLVLDALADTRVVFIAGARQAGKSTLARQIAGRTGHELTELSLDRRQTREAALADPEGFIAGLGGPAFIDEVQRAPDLLLAIKDAVDRDPTPGRFLLTGSANILTARTVKDALTGRMETIPLWPLSQSEIRGGSGGGRGANLVDALFASRPPHITGATVGREAFVEIVAAGGYPEALARTGRRRSRWFASYIDTTLDRDLRELSDARKLAEMPRLLRLLASQAANVLSYRSIAAKLDLSHDTVREYVGLLQTIFLIHLLPAWRPGIGARETRAPKAHMVDSGLLAHLLGAGERRIATDDQVTGRALENFVVTEVLKHADWSQIDTTAYHYRQREEEIDLVLESRAGELVAIEIKAAVSVARRDIKPMERLRDATGARFKAGALVCACAQTIPLGDRLWAVPISGLWEG
ncbi:MAG: ATP-binding protein [Solirubrobacteraceae bacterium]|jgi:predicted AAA+ superfamily ATPase